LSGLVIIILGIKKNIRQDWWVGCGNIYILNADLFSPEAVLWLGRVHNPINLICVTLNRISLFCKITMEAIISQIHFNPLSAMVAMHNNFVSHCS
jgi:hypothetical protein